MRPETAQIVIVGDDPLTNERVDRGLAAPGLVVRSAPARRTDLDRVLAQPTDLVILDLCKDASAGLGLLSALAQGCPRLPVITLTTPGRVADRVQALEAGAIDCLETSFVAAELRARVRARLRTARRRPAALRHGAIELDLLTRTARNHEQTVRLTNTEFDLLLYFMTHPRQLLSRRQLLRAVWNYEHDPASNILQQYVRYLRRKLDRDGYPLPIRTVRARGYWFGDPSTTGG